MNAAMTAITHRTNVAGGPLSSSDTPSRQIVVCGLMPGSAAAAQIRTACEATGAACVMLPPPPSGWLWRRLTRGSVLDGDGTADVVASADLVIDFAGLQPHPGAGEVWRFETACQHPLFAPYTLAAAWHRAPHAALVRLVRDGVDGSGPSVLAEAVVGVRTDYPTLLKTLVRTAAILLRQSLLGLTPCRIEAAPSRPATPDGPVAFAGGQARWFWARWRARMESEWWTIGVCPRSIEQVLRDGALGDVRWHAARPGKTYLADPFPWPGTDRILCESMPVTDGVGRIVALRRTADGRLEDAGEVLAHGGHLSYPGTWQEGAQIYMLPESVDDCRTVIYRLAADGTLAPISVVAEGSRLADPTLVHHQGRYWIAATDTAIGWHDNLCLFHADTLAGPWHAHAGNPVKLDIRSSRPAGPMIRIGQRLYRPAQDCAAGYGAAVVIHEVLTLSPDAFGERMVRRLAPDPSGPLPDGLHTLSAAGPVTLIDGKRMVLQPGRLVRKLLSRLTGVLRRTPAGGKQ
jgi:hypothetical protein